MLGLLFLALVLFVLAWLADQYLPHPLGRAAAILLGFGGFILVAYAVYSAIGSTGGAAIDSVLPAALARRRWARARPRP